MLRLSSVCLFCEATNLARSLYPSWTPTRTAATLQKRKPSRMTLAPNVKRGPITNAVSSRAPRKSRNSPFGSLNVTSAPRVLHDPRNRLSAAERKRTTRSSKEKSEPKTREPMRALKMQRALASVSYEKRGRVKEALVQRSNFEDFDLLPAIQESISSQALGGMVDVAPTPIQRLAIPALLGTDGRRQRRTQRAEGDTGSNEMQQFLLAAETGSGKTLAYVLPIIDAIKRAEAAEAAKAAHETAVDRQRIKERAANKLFDIVAPMVDEPDPSTARPRAIILVPTAELVDQVGRLVKSLSHTVKYRAALISAEYTGVTIRSRLFSTGGIDVVVCTPHLLHSITESDPNILSKVSHLVIDEADSLLDRSFAPTTTAILDRATPSLRQLILCSATIPRSLDSYMHKRFPNIRRLVTPNLHAIPRRVQLSVIDIDKIPYQGNRDLACAQVIWDIGNEAVEHGEEREEKKIVVFVNEREKTIELSEYLRKKGIDVVAMSRDSEDRKQPSILASFTGIAPPTSQKTTPAPPQPTALFSPAAISPGDLMDRPHSTTSTINSTSPPTRTLAHTKVLVATDLSSRGIDTLPVRHVILYDVPHTSIDFIHRLGRVGRMNRRGRGFVLVGRKDRKDIVREVREGMFKGAALI